MQADHNVIMSSDSSARRVRAALRWLLLPWWVLQVFSQEKSFQPNPILGSLRLSRRGFHVWRGRLAYRMTERRRRRLEHLLAPADRASFARNGYVTRKDFLPPQLFRQLLEELRSFAGEAGEFKEGDAITRRIPLTPEALRRLPACKALLALPEWRGLTRYVSSFDSEPLVFIQTIFTRVDDGQTDPQTTMHIDTFHPSMKAWLFLEDVAEEDGPFCYVPGSHLRTPRREVWERRQSIRAADPGNAKKGGAFRITKPELARIGAAKPKRFAVPANTLVVGDTYGFHARRRSTRPSCRIEIWAYSRHNPFLPWTRFGLSWPPQLAAYAAPIGWWLMELRGRVGLPAPQFRRVRVAPADPPAPWSLGPARRHSTM